MGNTLRQNLRLLVLCCLLLPAGAASPVRAANLQALQVEDATVLYEASLKPAAEQVAKLYPGVKSDLEAVFAWRFRAAPSILLVGDRRRFLAMGTSPLTLALAVPEKNAVAIDYSMMNTGPFRLEITLKHELCHLLLHQHIGRANLPRWLDEGLCQWASGGLGEIISDPKQSLLKTAALSRRFIRLKYLERRFPRDGEEMLLAYEQSKSIVEYIAAEYTRQGLLKVLAAMQEGEPAPAALQQALGLSLEELEKNWRDSLGSRFTWFKFVSYQLYEILFALAALITVYGFIKYRRRKREYGDDELDDGEPGGRLDA